MNAILNGRPFVEAADVGYHQDVRALWQGFAPASAERKRFSLLGPLSLLAVVAMQVREQEHQRQRERPDKRSNPRPDFEASSPTLGNSTGKID
jgi:hypothetical protein